MTEFSDDLQRVFRGYGDYHAADVETSGDFMPRLWERIEARRSPVFFIRRTALMLAGGSLAAALFMASVLIPLLEKDRPAGFYADVVASDSLSAEQEYAAASLLPSAANGEEFHK
jgi:hypothetical protein